MKNEIDKLAIVLWNYHKLSQEVSKSDLIWGLGCSRLEVAQRSSQLYLGGYAPILLFTGGYGKISKDVFKQTEATIFKNEAFRMGVPSGDIIIEDKSSNTIESVFNVKNLFDNINYSPKSIIIVTKPYMERRAMATLSLHFPDIKFSVTSPDLSYEQMTDPPSDKDQTINLMVGDLQRIIEYSNISLIPQIVPDIVLTAYNKLISLGFAKQILSEAALSQSKSGYKH